MKECRVCNTKYADDVVFCRVCGTKFPEQPSEQKKAVCEDDYSLNESNPNIQLQADLPINEEDTSVVEDVSSTSEENSSKAEQQANLSPGNNQFVNIEDDNGLPVSDRPDEEQQNSYEVETSPSSQNDSDKQSEQHEETNNLQYQSNNVINDVKLNQPTSKIKVFPIFTALLCIVAFVVLELTDTTFFIPSWHKNHINNQDSYEEPVQTYYDSRHGITELNRIDGLNIIESSNYIMGALEGQLYDSRFIPENFSQLSYFPSSLLELWNSTDSFYFSKEYDGRNVTVQTNAGDLLSGDGWLSCVCKINGQDKQVDAVTIDSTTFQYEIPVNASEVFYWWICSNYGGIDERTGNDVNGLIYFTIIDGKLSEATITFSNQETSILFKSINNQFNEVNFARSGTELNLKYDFYNGELISASGF